MRTYTIKIPTGQAFELGAVGNYVRVRTAAVELTVEAPDNNQRLPMEAGDAVKLSPFSRLRISHGSASTETVVLLIGDNTESATAKLAGQVSIAAPAGLAALADVSMTASAATKVADANSSRRELLLQFSQAVRLGGSTAAAAAGLLIPAGGAIVLTTTGEVWAYNTAASATTCTRAEVTA